MSIPGCAISTARRAPSCPTKVVVDDLVANGFERVKLWSRGVDMDIFHPQTSKRLESEPPIFLYVGRVAVEKNVEAFLELDLPGSKWVVGTGPALDRIRARFPRTNFLGVLERDDLAKVYAAADVFVFPSRTDTFGLVLLEAMACGLPVAAYPVAAARCDWRFERGRAARKTADCVPRSTQTAAPGCRGTRETFLMASGDRAVLRPPASALARCGASGHRLIHQVKQSLGGGALNSRGGQRRLDPE